MTSNLVVARVGRSSLHTAWLDRGVSGDWDLCLVPYQDIGDQSHLECMVSDVIAGPKWTGVREFLNGWDGWRAYDYVWLPDDDILTNQQTVSRMFSMAATLGLDLFAPALQDGSHYAHFTTMRNHSFAARWTGFVEIMMPGFSVAALEKLLWTLDLTQTGWGWGLDSLWPKLLDYQNVAVLDGAPMLHTRPVGVMRDEDLARRVRQESDSILSEHHCRQVHTTFAACGPDLRRLELTPEEFFAELVKGWDHLIEDDPRILTWIVDYQKELFRWPPYPIEGTP